MKTLLVGFDSAWTSNNSGAIVGVLLHDDGMLQAIGLPLTADFREAERRVLEWQATHQPTSTIVLLDQPTIVKNAAGQRPVEHIVSSAVSLRYGGMQPVVSISLRRRGRSTGPADGDAGFRDLSRSRDDFYGVDTR